MTFVYVAAALLLLAAEVTYIAWRYRNNPKF